MHTRAGVLADWLCSGQHGIQLLARPPYFQPPSDADVAESGTGEQHNCTAEMRGGSG